MENVAPSWGQRSGICHVLSAALISPMSFKIAFAKAAVYTLSVPCIWQETNDLQFWRVGDHNPSKFMRG